MGGITKTTLAIVGVIYSKSGARLAHLLLLACLVFLSASAGAGEEQNSNSEQDMRDPKAKRSGATDMTNTRIVRPWNGWWHALAFNLEFSCGLTSVIQMHLDGDAIDPLQIGSKDDKTLFCALASSMLQYERDLSMLGCDTQLLSITVVCNVSRIALGATGSTTAFNVSEVFDDTNASFLGDGDNANVAPSRRITLSIYFVPNDQSVARSIVGRNPPRSDMSLEVYCQYAVKTAGLVKIGSPRFMLERAKSNYHWQARE